MERRRFVPAAVASLVGVVPCSLILDLGPRITPLPSARWSAPDYIGAAPGVRGLAPRIRNGYGFSGFRRPESAHRLLFEIPRTFRVDRRDGIGGDGVRAFARSGREVVGLPVEWFKGGDGKVSIAVESPVARTGGPTPTVAIEIDGSRRVVRYELPTAPSTKIQNEGIVSWKGRALRLRAFSSPSKDADSPAVGGVARLWRGDALPGARVAIESSPLGTPAPTALGTFTGSLVPTGGDYLGFNETSIGPVPRQVRVCISEVRRREMFLSLSVGLTKGSAPYRKYRTLSRRIVVAAPKELGGHLLLIPNGDEESIAPRSDVRDLSFRVEWRGGPAGWCLAPTQRASLSYGDLVFASRLPRRSDRTTIRERIVFEQVKARTEAAFVLRSHRVPPESSPSAEGTYGPLAQMDARGRRAGLPPLFAR